MMEMKKTTVRSVPDGSDNKQNGNALNFHKVECQNKVDTAKSDANSFYHKPLDVAQK